MAELFIVDKKRNMKLNTLRYLDRKLGIPLCNSLYFFKKIFFRYKRIKFDRKKVKKILVIKIWGMGSIVLASPLFKNLKENFPEAEIWFLTKSGFESIYSNKFFNHTETIKLKGFLSAVWNFLKLIVKFRRNKFDLVIDLEIVSRYTALLSYLSGAKIKVGFEITGQNKDKFYDFKVLYHESKHISEMFLNTLKTLGLETVPRNPLPPVFANDTEEAFILKKYGVKKPYVVINISASELAYQRRLAPEQFSLIIKNISDFFPEYSIILIGSKEETNYVGGFKNVFLPEIRNVFDLSGKTNLSELFFIISEARLVISNDSGPAHAASSFGVPLIVFFGPESPTIYAPQGGEKTIFYSRIHCSPCISVYKDKKIKCQFDAECLTGIDVGKINKKVLEYLKNNRDKNHRNNFKEI